MASKQRVVIVTGAASGIGRGIARCFSAEGDQVVIADRSEAEGLTVVAELERNGASAIYCPMDLASEESLDRLLNVVEERLGPVDVLVNNAGMTFKQHAEDWSSEAIDKYLMTDLRGTLLLSQKAAVRMRRTGGGSIVFISSIHALNTRPLFSLYAGVKAGLVGMMKGLAQELAPDIRVNAILPGWTRNKLVESRIVDKTDEERKELAKQWGKKFPMGRIGEPEDIGHAAVFLASSKASFITGASLVVDGGESLGFAGAEYPVVRK